MNNQFFYCYSIELFVDLKRSGQKPICTGLHLDTKRQFWQYWRNDVVKQVVDQYFADKAKVKEVAECQH
jgi:hypothetical protein